MSLYIGKDATNTAFMAITKTYYSSSDFSSSTSPLNNTSFDSREAVVETFPATYTTAALFSVDQPTYRQGTVLIFDTNEFSKILSMSEGRPVLNSCLLPKSASLFETNRYLRLGRINDPGGVFYLTSTGWASGYFQGTNFIVTGVSEIPDANFCYKTISNPSIPVGIQGVCLIYNLVVEGGFVQILPSFDGDSSDILVTSGNIRINGINLSDKHFLVQNNPNSNLIFELFNGRGTYSIASYGVDSSLSITANRDEVLIKNETTEEVLFTSLQNKTHLEWYAFTGFSRWDTANWESFDANSPSSRFYKHRAFSENDLVTLCYGYASSSNSPPSATFTATIEVSSTPCTIGRNQVISGGHSYYLAVFLKEISGVLRLCVYETLIDLDSFPSGSLGGYNKVGGIQGILKYST